MSGKEITHDTKVEHITSASPVSNIAVVNTGVSGVDDGEVIINELPLSLLEFLRKHVVSSEFCEKLAVKVDDKVVVVLKKILEKTPDSLTKIADGIVSILSDGVLDTKDIPKLIMIVMELFNTDFRKVVDVSLNSQEIVQFVKFMIVLMIIHDFIKVGNKETALEMVAMSSQLLELVVVPLDVVAKKSCCCWRK